MMRVCSSRAIDRWLLGTAVAVLLVASPAAAQQNSAAPNPITHEGFLSPPEEIAKTVLAPRHLNVTLSNPSPDRKYFIKAQSEGMPTMAVFAKPHYYLGGVQVDHRANRARSLTTRAGSGFSIIDWESGKSTNIELPRGATATNPLWSRDGREVAYFAHFDNATHIYIANAATGKSRALTKVPVLATLVTSFEWTADGKSIVTVLIPEGRGAEPRLPDVPSQPKIRVTQGTKAQTRTYASLLETPHDKALLEYYATGQLAVIDAKSGAVRKVGKPAMIQSVDASPDGQYFRVTQMQHPFSYIVPVASFGNREELWDPTGKIVLELAKRELREGGGPGATDDDPAPAAQAARAAADTAKRGIAWNPVGPGMIYLQQEAAPRRGARDSTAGPANANQPRRKDRLYQWSPPYGASDARVLYESDSRMNNVRFSADGQVLFLSDETGEHAVYLSEPGKRYTITRGGGGRGGRGGGGGGGGGGAQTPAQIAAADSAFYNAPGSLMTKRGPNGAPVVQMSSDQAAVYLSGTKYFPDPTKDAPRNFVDRLDVKTGNKTRVFESDGQIWETVSEVLDDDFTRVIVSRESPTTVPDFYFRDMKAGTVKKLTNNVDYSPELTKAIRKIIPVERVDGYKFFVNITLPPDYVQGTKLPAMFWFYPREFTDQGSYDRTRRTLNKTRFPSVSTRDMDILTKLGYAVVEPDAPIVGENGRMNDNYVSDLRNNLTAVIDTLVSQGYIDRNRIGIGGHSYGAFSTVNAMVHTPYFKAGIAGDGNYLRALTPNGFQSERRDLWEARETYLEMSPLLYADKLNGALLMYHGMADQNVGTAPINSERLYHALMGLGKTASLYMYPYEDHGPATKETNLDLWARWVAWLDTYVKNPKKEGIAIMH
jgi:dipeptidyl aminopeptidase/acylaminoacyl peptidase